MKQIKTFLQSKKDDIGFGDEDIDSLLKKKSMRCGNVQGHMAVFTKIDYYLGYVYKYV